MWFSLKSSPCLVGLNRVVFRLVPMGTNRHRLCGGTAQNATSSLAPHSDNHSPGSPCHLEVAYLPRRNLIQNDARRRKPYNFKNIKYLPCFLLLNSHISPRNSPSRAHRRTLDSYIAFHQTTHYSNTFDQLNSRARWGHIRGS